MIEKVDMKELRETFEKMYHFEDERKRKLYVNLQWRITVLVLIIGVIAYYLQNLPYLGCDRWSIFFYIFFGLTSISGLWAVYLLIRSFYNYGYSYPPIPSVITKDVEKIKKYYQHRYFKNYKKEKIEKLIQEDVDDFIAEYYKRSLEKNIAINDKRAYYLHYCSSALIATIIFLILSIPFYFSKYYSNPRIPKIEIIDSQKEVK